MRYWLLIYFCWGLSLFGVAQRHLYYAPASTQAMLEPLPKTDPLWQPLPPKGQLPPKNSYWIRIDFEEDAPKAIEDYLLVLGLNVDEARLILPSGKQLRSGRLVPAHQKNAFLPEPVALFRTSERPRSGESWYARVEERSGMPLELSPKVYDFVQWEREQAPIQQRRYLMQAAFQGTIWVMVVYSMAIFLTYLDKVYLYYACYMAAISVFVAQSYGMLIEFVLGDFPELDVLFRAAGIHLAAIFYFLFMRSFLDLESLSRRLWRGIKVLEWVVLANLLLSMVILLGWENVRLYRVETAALFGMIYIAVITASLWLWRRDRNNILLRYFLGGTLAIMVSGVVGVTMYFVSSAPVNLGFWAQNGVVFEIIFFSLGLGYRMKAEEKEKRRIEAENARILLEQNQLLEEKVLERTHEIELKSEEILTQNEELHQQQEEIIAQRDYIEEKNAELKEQNQRITDSLRYAQTIQESILPATEVLEAAFQDHFVMYYPKDIVSGDFYWYEKVDDYQFVAVVDCTGHGVPGAFMSMMGSILLNEIVIEERLHQPSDILEELDKLLRYSLNQSSGSNRDGMDVCLCRIAPVDDGFELCFAGAKRPLLVQFPERSSVEVLAPTRRSIGGRTRKERVFEEQRLVVPSQTRLFLFSDGYADQHNMSGIKLGSLQLQQHIEQTGQASLQEQGLLLHNALKAHQEQQSQRDDITLVGIELGIQVP